MIKSEPPPQLPGLVHLRFLGSGGYADVHLYRQLSLDREVAVKVLKGAGLTDAVRRQFAIEANTMAGLGRHPHIVQIFEVGESTAGRPYLTMEYYPGDNLADRVAKRGRFSVDDVLRIGIQITGAVHSAHAVDILHRDIKPANILVSVADEPGLSDFGIAGRGAEDEDGLGVSIPWSPPEVLYGGSNGSVASDVYSLAGTLWQLLVGRSPFAVPGDNEPLALMQRVRSMPAPATGRADVPAALDRLLQQAMAKQPSQRPASALDLGRALQSIEQELRLPRTKIVVLGTGSESGRPPAGTVDVTRLRAPRWVAAQSPPANSKPTASPPPPIGPAFGQTTARRTPSGGLLGSPPPAPVDNRKAPVREAPAAHTVMRPSAPVPAADPEPRGATPGGGLRRAHVFSIAAAVIVLATVVAVVLGSGGSRGSAPPAAVPSDPASDQVAIDLPAPAKPVVSVRQLGANLRFSWTTDPAAAPGDEFLWRTSSGLHGIRQTPTLDLPARGKVCLQVAVRRAGAGVAPLWSDQTCGP